MFKYKFLFIKSEGQLLIEALVGLAIVTIALSFGVILVFGGQNILIDRTQSLEARSLGKEGIEAGAILVKNNWDTVSDGDHGISYSNGSWQFGSTSDVSGPYIRKIAITTIDGYQKEIVSTVTWTTTNNRNLSYEITTLITNWKASEATGGDTGGGGLSGDWRNPQTLGSIDLGPGNSATDLDVKSKIVYLSAEASASAKPDFFIVDATVGTSPTILSSINTGPSLDAVDAAGNYAYLGNRNTSAQLQIVDITNLSSPLLITSFKLPGVSGSGAVGQSVFYYAERVYVGTKKATGPEFNIVDVSDPLNPSWLGAYEIDGDINSIQVEEDLAYVTNSTDNEIIILNISNPSSPTLIGSYNAPGGEDGKIGYKLGSSIYLGRKSGGSEELIIIDVSSSTSPKFLGSEEMSVDVNDIRTRDNLVFLGTSNSNSEFQVWDVVNSADPVFVSSFNFPQVATGIDYEDNLVYVAVRSNDALRIITSSN